MLNIAAICLVVTALLAYLNHRFVRLPTTIGVMVIALVLSLSLVGLDAVGLDYGLRQYEESLLRSIDFSDVLMQGMLSFLLFAGALHVDLTDLGAYRWQVGGLAVIGTLASTFVVGWAIWWVLPWIGVQLPLIYCLLFGALISPTDPIAVMGILKSAGAPKNLELVIAGESLFNDGVGVVIFSLLLGVLASGSTPTAGAALTMLMHEAGGGILFGMVLGYVTFRLLKSVDQYQVEVLLTLAAVVGGYAAAASAARVRAAGHGGDGPDDRQPGPGHCHVRHDAPLCRHVLGTGRRDSQCSPFRTHRHGGAADRLLPHRC